MYLLYFGYIDSSNWCTSASPATQHAPPVPLPIYPACSPPVLCSLPIEDLWWLANGDATRLKPPNLIWPKPPKQLKLQRCQRRHLRLYSLPSSPSHSHLLSAPLPLTYQLCVCCSLDRPAACGKYKLRACVPPRNALQIFHLQFSQFSSVFSRLLCFP